MSSQDVRAAAVALVEAFAAGRLDDYFGSFDPEATFVFHTTPERARVADRVPGCAGRTRAASSRVVPLLGCRCSATAPRCSRTTWRRACARRPARRICGDRETIVFARRDGRSLAVHEHLSAAADATGAR